MLTLIIYFVIASVLLGAIFYGAIFGAMYMRIPSKKLEKIIKLGKLKQDMTVYDLGAGLGTIAIEAAYSGAYVVAVERNPLLVGCMKILLWFNNFNAKRYNQTIGSFVKVKSIKSLNVDLVKANLLDVDLSTADVVYCYLFGPLMQRVGEKAKREMKENSLLISVEHQIKGWKPKFVDKEDKIYVYRVGKLHQYA